MASELSKLDFGLVLINVIRYDLYNGFCKIITQTFNSLLDRVRFEANFNVFDAEGSDKKDRYCWIHRCGFDDFLRTKHNRFPPENP